MKGTREVSHGRARTVLSLSALVAATALLLPVRRHPALADSVLGIDDLTEADALFARSVRTDVVDGRAVFYPSPTRELEKALSGWAASAAEAEGRRVALRHLAEARRELGDLAGAEAALRDWAGSASPDQAFDAWDEVSRWARSHGSWKLAFEAAEKALSLPPARSEAAEAARRALATDRIGWARSRPEEASALSLMAARSRLFPADASFADEWVRALVAEGKRQEAEEAIRSARALPEETGLLAVAELKGRAGDEAGALAALEAYVSDPARRPSPRVVRAWSERAEKTARARLETLRQDLDARFDAKALLLLELYLRGRGRGGDALDLLSQVEARHGASLDRGGHLLLSRLWAELDSAPEAFRSRLAAAIGASPADQAEDLAELARLALAAGARPLAWGTYSDEPYRWAARVDVTPGFFTGALSFLLTGLDGESALGDLSGRRLPERTFATARRLVQELARRSPDHRELPSLHLALMERHVARGEGQAALDLLPKADRGGADVRSEARRVALLAVRQTKAPVDRELSLWKERLSLLAPDGSRPPMGAGSGEEYGGDEGEGEYGYEGRTRDGGLDLRGSEGPLDAYRPALSEALSRLSARDRTRRTALSLLLGELDRMPDAEGLWVWAADQVESWDVAGEMEGRYRTALRTFGGPGWWNRLARWYVRRDRRAELKALVDDVVATFRGSELFARDPGLSGLVPVEGQPEVYVFAGDYLRLKALERFPASRTVVRAAEARLYTRSSWDGLTPRQREAAKGRAVVEDDLLARRRDALLFTDPVQRSRFLDRQMEKGALEALLLRLESSPSPSPVTSRLLLDGWARLSRFERAVAHADALAASYPGDEGIAAEAVTLHRSLSLLSPREAEAAARIAAAAAPALPDPAALLTQVGEMWEDLDRPGAAREVFQKLLSRDPRDPGRILEVATLFWDYGHMAEASAVLAEGRKRVGRPRMHAFEAGVLREELKDLPGALDEYLAAIQGEATEGEEAFETHEWRAQNRLARLLARPTVRGILAGRIRALVPGEPTSEVAFVPYLSLLGLVPEESDPWDDWMETAPADVVGREQRSARKAEARPAERLGIEEVGALVLSTAEAMARKATREELLTALRRRQDSLLDPRWSGSPERAVQFESSLLLREAELSPTPEGRLVKEVARARFLLGKGRAAEARAALEAARPRAESLAEGPAKVRALASLALATEAIGADASASWREVSTRYPTSLGVLEDHVAFLLRTGRAAEALDRLEQASGVAAEPHRQALTRRLVEGSLEAGDLARARRGVGALLSLPLDPPSRITAATLLARLSWRQAEAFDAVSFAKVEAERLPEDVRPDLWASLAAGARLESRPKESLTLSIEALNRRMDRAWLHAACRNAAEAGLASELLGFFEAQRKRSPRDVRWAVAVREIRRHSGDLDGAIASAREACDVAPERESLQREAVELMERAGRLREASDFLSTWARSRPADEGVASWRASLLVRAGEPMKAVELEREAVAAFRKDTADARTPEEKEAEAAERLARAARRFASLRQPRAAWAILAPDGAASSARRVPLSWSERAEVALLSGHLPALVAAFGRDEEFRSQAAATLSRLMRSEDRAALERQLLGLLFPAGRGPDEAALHTWWEFAGDCGLGRFREAVALRLLAARGGPWGERPPVEFVRRLVAVEPRPGSSPVRLRFVTSDFEPRWVEYLASRDRLVLLEPLLAPMLAEVDGAVAGTKPATERPFASWFPVEAFVRIASAEEKSSLRSSVERWLATKEAWTRFHAVTGGRWDTRLLMTLVSPQTRLAWLTHTEALREAQDRVGDPVAERRQAEVRRVGEAVGALLRGAPGSAAAPEIARLRGPRTVGEVFGKDPSFLWPALAAGPGQSGDDGVAGSGSDSGRLPGRLWGARPGEAWYVLETIARLREKDPLAAEVPLEATARGEEARRTLLSVRTAEALGDPARALALDERFYADLSRADRLGRRLGLLLKVPEPEGGRPRAEALWKKEVARQQGRADEALFRAWERASADLKLPPPLDVLDPATPLSPALLAFVYDRFGPAKGSAFRTTDDPDFRSALSARWSDVETLDSERTTYLLDELWARGAARFPDRAVRKLGLFWPEASAYLEGLETASRTEGLAAVRALPDPKGVAALAARTGDPRGGTQLLLLRAELLSGDDEAALARLGALAARESGPSALRWGGALAPRAPDEEAGEEAGEPAPAHESEGAGPAAGLRRALAVFRASGRAGATERAEALLGERLRKSLASSVPDLDDWRLAFDLARGPDAVAGLVAALERSWVRGELVFDVERAAVARLLVGRDDDAALRWAGRLSPPATLEDVRTRATILVRLKRFDEARAAWTDARARLPLDRDEEAAAFDEWRRVPTPPATAAPGTPGDWANALAFWQRKGAELDRWGGGLTAHLETSPYDRNAARAALRSLAPAPESIVAPAAATLGGWSDVTGWRAGRFDLSRSARSARSLVTSTHVSLRSLRNRRFPKAEIEGLLSDLARIGAEAGPDAMVDQALSALEDLGSPSTPALRAELVQRRARRVSPPDLSLGVTATLAPLRPRDLTWETYSRLLDAEVRP